MKKIIEILGLIFGTLGIFIIANSIAIKYDIHAFGWEQIVTIFVTFLKMSMAVGFILFMYWLVWKPIFSWFDRSFKNKGEKWEALSDREKLWYSLVLFGLLLVLFGLLF